jgi:hypothetical protein
MAEPPSGDILRIGAAHGHRARDHQLVFDRHRHFGIKTRRVEVGHSRHAPRIHLPGEPRVRKGPVLPPTKLRVDCGKTLLDEPQPWRNGSVRRMKGIFRAHAGFRLI